MAKKVVKRKPNLNNPKEKTARNTETICFRAKPSEKLTISAFAQKNGMDLSNYCKMLVLSGHEKLLELWDDPREQIVDQFHQEQIESTLIKLKDSYPLLSDSELILKALQLALDNDKRIISNKIKNY